VHISIVGGGPAGLVAAIAARRAGIDCTVYEQAPSFARVGGAVGIQGNGLRVLDALGVLDDFQPRTEILTRATLEAPPGRVVSVADFRELSLPYMAFGVALRYDLQEALLEAAHAAGATILFNKRCIGAEYRDRRIVLTFSDGYATTCEIVLACDGIHSAVRETLGITSRRRVVNEAYLRLVAPIRHPDADRIGEVWATDGRRAGSFPLPNNRTYVFCSVPLGNWQHILTDSLDEWVESWRDFGPPISTLMESITDWRSAVYDELTDLRAKCWHNNGAFLLGDAAHAMTPNLGQGANSAMVDALVLINLLAHHCGDVTAAGAEYQRIRKAFVTRIQHSALLGGRMASWTSAVARDLRDTFIRVGSRIGPLRRSSMRLTAGFNPREQPWLRTPRPVW
jgi:2-polyprenyl-6-methoxyphenol hydroxylase-like FAD-dependent oxidoreductase